MTTSIRLSSIYVLDQDQALDFYVGKLGFEVKDDVDLGFMRWLTVVPAGDPSREVLLEVPGPPALDPDTAEQVRLLLTKGATGGWIGLDVDDPHTVFEKLVADGVDITDEISEKDYGVDFGIRDPFGNRIRIGRMQQR